jgi:putative peptidoglycan lipid II flippase
MTLIRSIATIGGYTLISRVLGFARDMLIAAALGAGMVADAFFVAFRLPNLFRSLFAEGAFSAAFVPLFAGKLAAEGEAGAKRFSEEALSVLLAVLLVFVLAFEIAMPWVMRFLAPGFVDDPATFDLAILFTRITFPFLLFISLVSLLAGILNSLGRFAAPAATPIVLNLVMIASVVFLARFTPTAGHALAWGVTASGAAQFIWLLASVKRAGHRLRLRRPRLTPEIRVLLRRILPVAVGAGMYQVNLLISTMIATLLPAGAISYLFYADRVNQLPLGVVGIAVGTALLPLIAREIKSGQEAEALANQNRALEFSCLLTFPAAAALVILAEPIVHVLFERGAFGPTETTATAAALAVFATGLPALVLVKALTPGFFARDDTKTPIQVAGAAIVANVLLNLVLMGPLLHVGLAAGNAISAWLNAVGLAVILTRRRQFALDDRAKRRLPRIVSASLLMAAGLAAGVHVLRGALSGDLLASGGALAVLIGGGLVLYALLARLTGAADGEDLRQAFRRPPRGEAAGPPAGFSE